MYVPCLAFDASRSEQQQSNDEKSNKLSFWEIKAIFGSKAIDTAVDRIAIGTVHGTAHDA